MTDALQIERMKVIRGQRDEVAKKSLDCMHYTFQTGFLSEVALDCFPEITRDQFPKLTFFLTQGNSQLSHMLLSQLF